MIVLMDIIYNAFVLLVFTLHLIIVLFKQLFPLGFVRWRMVAEGQKYVVIKLVLFPLFSVPVGFLSALCFTSIAFGFAQCGDRAREGLAYEYPYPMAR